MNVAELAETASASTQILESNHASKKSFFAESNYGFCHNF